MRQESQYRKMGAEEKEYVEVDLEEDVNKEGEDQIYQMRFEQHWLTML